MSLSFVLRTPAHTQKQNEKETQTTQNQRHHYQLQNLLQSLPTHETQETKQKTIGAGGLGEKYGMDRPQRVEPK